MTFDCYGTLVDWEGALTDYLQPVLLAHDVHVFNGTILEFFSEFEPSEQDAGGTYKDVLRRVIDRYGARLGFTPSEEESEGFVECIARAEPFEDTVESLKHLKEHFNLAIVSNTDTDLIAITLKNLEVEFDSVVTAEELGTYKPSALEKAINQMDTKNERILHVAQSPFHDIKPASDMGLSTVQIQRYKESASAVKQVDINPSWSYDSLQDLVNSIHEA